MSGGRIITGWRKVKSIEKEFKSCYRHTSNVVFKGRDAAQVPDLMERMKTRYPQGIRSMSFDKAFFSKTNFECVQAAGVEGCKTTDSTYLHWVDCAVFIPNIFTPNDDNINDAWSVHFGSVRQIKIEVLNRWGNI